MPADCPPADPRCGVDTQIFPSLRGWISGTYLDKHKLLSLSENLGDEPSLLGIIPDFLLVSKAEELGEYIRHSVTWDRSRYILGMHQNEEIPVSEEQWLSTPEAKHFSQFDVGPSLQSLTETSPGSVLSQFFNLLRSSDFMRWMSVICREAVHELTGVRLTRYRNGDFIREHLDSQDGRIVRCNLYLSQTWTPKAGGCLMFRNQTNTLTKVFPILNTLVLTPVSQGCSHWVTAVTSPVATRESLAFSFRPKCISSPPKV
jgi:Rps23 Pro-64 3,4-dihydroxylase Tpa1-like proline 4-hydroxylase